MVGIRAIRGAYLMAAMFSAVTFLQSGYVEGFTFLERGKDIVEQETMCSLGEREALFDSFKFNERIEFDEGDLGLSGGVQQLESVTKNSKDGSTDDRIQ